MKIFNKTVLVGLSGLVLGAAVILGIRFTTYHKETVHYHANFAVYINGQREAFKNMIYYTETACRLETADITPMERAHMHDSINDVVHVEDHAVTWGQFFENLGWYVGPDFIQQSDGKLYKADDISKLNVLVNGQDYTGIGAITNMVIHDKDRVLVSYGIEDQKELEAQFGTVASTATKYDTDQDPVSCSGNHKTTTSDRLKHLL